MLLSLNCFEVTTLFTVTRAHPVRDYAISWLRYGPDVTTLHSECNGIGCNCSDVTAYRHVSHGTFNTRVVNTNGR